MYTYQAIYDCDGYSPIKIEVFAQNNEEFYKKVQELTTEENGSKFKILSITEINK